MVDFDLSFGTILTGISKHALLIALTVDGRNRESNKSKQQ
jgi:hypothetical protein